MIPFRSGYPLHLHPHPKYVHFWHQKNQDGQTGFKMEDHKPVGNIQMGLHLVTAHVCYIIYLGLQQYHPPLKTIEQTQEEHKMEMHVNPAAMTPAILLIELQTDHNIQSYMST